MYNFGQPRVGDKDFSAFVTANNIVPNSYRVVHNKDIIPHTPSSEFPTYFEHTCIEAYEDVNHVVHGCSTSVCEDPSCSFQKGPIGLNTADHLLYLNHCMG
jgi:hypothetical protein